MKEKIPQSKLILLFSDIIKGHSKIWVSSFGYLFIKHLSFYDSAEIDSRYEEFLQKAIKSGARTIKEQEEYLISEGLWSQQRTNEIDSLNGFIESVKRTKSQMSIPSQIAILNKQIKDAEEKIIKLQIEKNELLGPTAESFASKKAQEFHIKLTVFKDSKLNMPFFTDEMYEELEDEMMKFIITSCNKISEEMSQNMLKRIAIAPFFLNLFALCNGNAFNFYGKPVCDLTFNQSQLFGHGIYYKNLLESSTNAVPEYLLEDPDGLTDWYNASKNAEKVLNSKESIAGGTSITHATRKDYEQLGVNPENIIDLGKEAAKKGGSLTYEDLLKLHGV